MTGSAGGPALRGRHATPWGQGFGRVVGYTLLGSIFPGAGLIAAGRRVIGGLILGACALGCLVVIALVALSNPVELIGRQVLAHPERLTYLAAGVIALGVLWAIHVVATNLSLRRFASLTGAQSVLSWAMVTTLALGGLVTTVARGQEALLGRDTLTTIFSGSGALNGKGPNSGMSDPWVNVPRVNVLLIGSDAGADRTGLRTDTLMVASIDTKTGETVLFSIPRNLEHVPFPTGSKQAMDYPQGFYCAQDACLINALWQFGVEHAAQYYPGDKNPGLTATVQGVQQALGIDINDYAMVDLRGFMQFVDAIGGLTINVGRRLPVGGHKSAGGYQVGVTSYIEPGRRKLNGYEALWYARSRSDSDDYERMTRQRCVIGALTQQADPKTVALHITEILNAAKNNIRTNIPIKDIDAWVTLALRVKKAHVRSLPFTERVIAPGNPDFNKIHNLVQDALTTPPAGAATATPTITPSPISKNGKATASPSTSPSTDPQQAVDLATVC
jgi:LCP family protein required for cell wall assembly